MLRVGFNYPTLYGVKMKTQTIATTWLAYLLQGQRECTWAENFLDSENSGVEIKLP